MNASVGHQLSAFGYRHSAGHRYW